MNNISNHSPIPVSTEYKNSISEGRSPSVVEKVQRTSALLHHFKDHPLPKKTLYSFLFASSQPTEPAEPLLLEEDHCISSEDGSMTTLKEMVPKYIPMIVKTNKLIALKNLLSITSSKFQVKILKEIHHELQKIPIKGQQLFLTLMRDYELPFLKQSADEFLFNPYESSFARPQLPLRGDHRLILENGLITTIERMVPTYIQAIVKTNNQAALSRLFRMTSIFVWPQIIELVLKELETCPSPFQQTFLSFMVCLTKSDLMKRNLRFPIGLLMNSPLKQLYPHLFEHWIITAFEGQFGKPHYKNIHGTSNPADLGFFCFTWFTKYKTGFLAACIYLYHQEENFKSHRVLLERFQYFIKKDKCPNQEIAAEIEKTISWVASLSSEESKDTISVHSQCDEESDFLELLVGYCNELKNPSNQPDNTN